MDIVSRRLMGGGDGLIQPAPSIEYWMHDVPYGEEVADGGYF